MSEKIYTMLLKDNVQRLMSLIYYFVRFPEFCKYKSDGEYRDPYDGCKGFIHCHNYFADYKLCPSNLLFNDKKGQCDWPSNVNCPVGRYNNPYFVKNNFSCFCVAIYVALVQILVDSG